MNRETLPADAGMAFVYPEDVRGAFWMKDTLIPLSIAFYSGDGRILKILDMEPCKADPCPLYDPGVGPQDQSKNVVGSCQDRAREVP